MRLVLDAGAVSRLAERTTRSAAVISVLRQGDHWPPVVPSVVLVECLGDRSGRDPAIDRFLRTCDVLDQPSTDLARRAAFFRSATRRGSTIEAIVVATAEPGSLVLTTRPRSMAALAAHADGVLVEGI